MKFKSGSKNINFKYLAIFILTKIFLKNHSLPTQSYFLFFLQNPTSWNIEIFQRALFQLQFKGKAKFTAESLTGANI